jgi:hypothetical protein
VSALQQAGFHQLIYGASQRVAIDAESHSKKALRREAISGPIGCGNFLLQLAGNLRVKRFSVFSADCVKTHM